MAQGDKVDAVIVGGGAAGILLAAKLGHGGKKVVVLEQGPAWQLSDLVSSQIWSRRLKWGTPPVQLDGKNPIAHNFNTGSGFGGAALHHYANWPRLHPEDFRMKTQYGRGLDWPISYAELRPYYDRIQTEVGVSGDAKAEVWRPPGAPYPLPPLKTFRQAEVMAKGFAAIGQRTAPMPQAILSRPYKGRPACIYDGWCDAGCPIGALANPLVTYLPAAQKAGADFRAHSYVTRVLMNDKGDRALGVEYYDAQKERQEQHADVVILASTAVQNPKLLLNSATDKHPDGIANSSGLVGRYFMVHFGGRVLGLFDEDLENHMGTTGNQLICQESYAKDKHGGPFGSYTWQITQAFKPNDITGLVNARGNLFGDDLHAFMRQAAKGLAAIQALGEQLPDPDNRVTLGDKKDEYGFPLARVTHANDDNMLALWRYALDEGMRAMKGAGAKEAWTAPSPGLIHVMGGTVMGKSAKDSVCDSYGRTHDVRNLVLAGTGVNPTEGGVHPTFTMHALALRTSEHMLGNWRNYA